MRTLMCTLGLAVVLGQAAHAGTYTVPADFPTIQAAIDFAVDGDTILVEPGIYQENLTVQYKYIAIKSKHGPHVTILKPGTAIGQASQPIVKFVNSPDDVPTVEYALEGFTMTEGKAAEGAAVELVATSPRLANLIVRDNQTRAGVIFCGTDSSPTIVGCIITNNDARPNFTVIRCCGISVGARCAPRIVNCTLAWNGNTAPGQQLLTGGIYLEGATTAQSHPVIVNTVSWNNGPFDVYMQDNPQPTENHVDLFHCTFYHPASNFSYTIRTGTGSVPFSDSQCNAWDPQLIDPINGDCHLSAAGSVARDSALADPAVGAVDVDGDPRTLGGGLDRGADEFNEILYSDGNVTPGGQVNFHVISAGPGRLVTLWYGSSYVDPPVPTPYGPLYLSGTITWVPMPNTNAMGSSVLSLAIPVFPPAPYDTYWQALVFDPITSTATWSNLNISYVR